MKKMYLFAVIALSTCTTFGAELFVRVARNGSHVASVFNQTQTNSSNIYRFYELPGGATNLLIKDQYTGFSLCNQTISIASNQRMVGEVDYWGNFRVIETTTLNNDNWYSSTPTPTQGCGGYPLGPTYSNAGTVSKDALTQFLTMMEDESFDSNRLDFAKGFANKNSLSASQIAEISKRFDFDSNRLDWAKHAYDHCYDKGSYFLLKNTFTFSSNYSALEDYIEGR